MHPEEKDIAKEAEAIEAVCKELKALLQTLWWLQMRRCFHFPEHQGWIPGSESNMHSQVSLRTGMISLKANGDNAISDV